MLKPKWFRFSLRSLVLLVLLVLLSSGASAFAADAAQSWAVWDGVETVAQYAQRVHLNPTKTLDLANGVKMEFVLIPAGEFIMGTPSPAEPPAVDEEGFYHSSGIVAVPSPCGALRGCPSSG